MPKDEANVEVVTLVWDRTGAPITDDARAKFDAYDSGKLNKLWIRVVDTEGRIIEAIEWERQNNGD